VNGRALDGVSAGSSAVNFVIPDVVKRFYRDFRWTWTTATAGSVAAERWRRP
jgi:hypothetical protein